MRTDVILELDETGIVMLTSGESYLFIIPSHTDGPTHITAEFETRPAGRFIVSRLLEGNSIDPITYGQLIDLVNAADIPEEGHAQTIRITPLTAAAYQLLNDGDPADSLSDFVEHCHSILSANNVPCDVSELIVLSAQSQMDAFEVHTCSEHPNGGLLMVNVNDLADTCTDVTDGEGATNPDDTTEEEEIPLDSFIAALNIPDSPILFVTPDQGWGRTIVLESTCKVSARESITSMVEAGLTNEADAERLHQILDNLGTPGHHDPPLCITVLTVLALRAMKLPFEYLLLQFMQYEGRRDLPDFTTLWDRAWELWHNPLQHEVKLIIHSEAPEAPETADLIAMAALWGGTGALSE